MKTKDALSDTQMDALREFGNIGSAHAATSLSMMISQEIEMRVPDLEVVPLSAVSSFIDPDGPAVGLYFLLLDGNAKSNGHIYLIFPEDSAKKMSDMLFSKEIGTTKAITMEERSALMEVGNILVSSFGDASAGLLGVTMMPSPPTYRFGMARKLIQGVAVKVGKPTSRAIMFKTSLTDATNQIKGYLVLLPEPETLDSILKLLEEKTHGDQ
jgi:chemotaxis protein CheC